MVARFVMKSNKKRIIVVLAILTMAILLSCALVACTKADTGDRGTNGTNGQDGIDGKSAYQIWLDNGHTGTETDFLTWLKGKDGTNGLNGKDGKDGANGTNGQDGIDGKSAYQIWLDNGNTGTEADFLTWLKGKDGANGQDGANGKDGAGIQSATINNNGELIVTLDDGTIINAGQVVAPEKRLDENNQITCKTFEKTDKTIYGKVSNVTETFYFTDEIELKGGASYSVYTDFDCSNEIISKVVKLNVGDNTFYILEKCGKDSKFYTVTIRRREIYTVSFAVNDGTPLENSTIKVEEDSLVPKDSVPSSPRDGYDLVWDNDFTSPITENTVITATLTAIYSVSENTITGLTDYGKSLTVLNIPNVIDGKSVTSIDDYAFSGCKGLTSVTIGNSVTYIGFSAFRDCTSLTTVTIPDNVTNIGEHAFGGTVWYNNQLNGLVYAGKVAYQYKGEMPSNTSIVIKEGTLGIGDYAFRNCSGLTSVVIPDSVTSIGGGAFAGCKGLTSITIPNSVTSIGEHAFNGCSSLTSITIPERVTSIGYSAFSGCTGLTSITIPDSVTSIRWQAFYGCTELTSVTIGNSVTSIGKYAFYGCIKLVEVYNKSTLSITADSSSNGYVAYYAKNVYTNEGGSKLTTDENGYVIYMDGYEMILVSYRGTNIELVLPSYITKINQNAFSGCSSLTSITIPDSVTSIDDYAFNGCTGLTNITIPDSVTSIGRYAFMNCTGLTNITIPDSVTSIVGSAFNGCTGLTSIIVDEGNTKYHSAGNCLIETATKTLISGCKTSVIPTDGSVTSIGDDAFRNCSGLTSVVIPDSVTSIGGGAFAGCKGLTSITIPNSVTSIGYSAFAYCTGLTSITIPDSVTSIGDDAFRNCSGLTSVVIPDSVTSIGRYAFMNCTGLTNITIPDSVTSIGDRAFYDTTWYNNQPDGLVYAGKVAYKYKGTMPSNTSIVLKEGTLGITDYAFEGCSGLTSITIPDSVTSVGYAAFSGCTGLIKIIGPSDAVSAVAKQCDSKAIAEIVITSGTSISDCAFRDCTSLTTVTIPDSVTSIDGSAFSGCTGLTSITIPNGVTSICNYAFFGCTGLTTINFNGTITQWKAISKGTDWKYKVPSTCKVVCTDGEIPISEA